MLLDMTIRKSPNGYRAILRGIQFGGEERILHMGEVRDSAQEAQADLHAAIKRIRKEKPEAAEEGGVGE